MKKILLSKCKFAIVSDENFEWLNRWKWTADKGYSTFYAHRRDYKTREKIYMHRLILNAKSGEVVDHINRNGLDNRRENLRIVTPTQNNYNQKIRSDNKSGYRGIWWSGERRKWIVEIWNKKKKYYFGGYKDINDAISIKNTNFHWIQEVI